MKTTDFVVSVSAKPSQHGYAAIARPAGFQYAGPSASVFGATPGEAAANAVARIVGIVEVAERSGSVPSRWRVHCVCGATYDQTSPEPPAICGACGSGGISIAEEEDP